MSVSNATPGVVHLSRSTGTNVEAPLLMAAEMEMFGTLDTTLVTPYLPKDANRTYVAFVPTMLHYTTYVAYIDRHTCVPAAVDRGVGLV
jgi:hypothetical protein